MLSDTPRVARVRRHFQHPTSLLRLPCAGCIYTLNVPLSLCTLGVLLDSDLSMKQHVTKTCQLAYMELKKIAAIRPFLTEDATKTLVSILHSFEVRLLQLRSPRVPFKCHSSPLTHTKLSSPSHLQIASVPTLQPSSEKATLASR